MDAAVRRDVGNLHPACLTVERHSAGSVRPSHSHPSAMHTPAALCADARWLHFRVLQTTVVGFLRTSTISAADTARSSSSTADPPLGVDTSCGSPSPQRLPYQPL